jgi:mono/diheme cytochrome c family protein
VLVVKKMVVVLLLFGCSESTTADGSDPPAGDTAGQQSGVTFHQEVAPILEERCATCHTDGGAAPFVLDEYESAASMAEAALASIKAGRMPPWMPDRDCRTFEGERYITPEEIATLEAWVADGKQQGAATEKTAPVVAAFEATDVARVPSPYIPSDTAPDDYRCFLLDIDLPETRYMTASRVLPDQGSPVHHVLVYAVNAETGATLAEAAAQEPGEGYTCFGGPFPNNGESGSGGAGAAGFAAAGGFPNQIGAWVPGIEPSESGSM